VLEPNARYFHNWHIDAICAHLEAVDGTGRITRLLINVPPGSMKVDAGLGAVAGMGVGTEGKCARCASSRPAFNDGPVKRDTRKCRDLMLFELVSLALARK